MQTTLSRRFLVISAAVLGTTVLPWFIWGVKGGQSYGISYGLDLQGGASITYRVPASEGQDQKTVMDEAVRVIQYRLDRFGLSEINLTRSEDRFTVELPGRGKAEIDRIKAIMKQVGALEFHIQADTEPGPDAQTRRTGGREAVERPKFEKWLEKKDTGYVTPPGYRWVQVDQEGKSADKFPHSHVLLEVPEEKAQAEFAAAEQELAEAVKAGKPEADLAAPRQKAREKREEKEKAEALYLWIGKAIATSFVAPDSERPGTYSVHFEMVADRQAKFGDFTGQNVGRHMAIVLNQRVQSSPVLQSKLPGSGRITGDFEQDKAQDLVTVLQSGSLAVQPEEISYFVVGPGLGEDAVRRGKWAIGISTALVLLFMAVLYRGAGWVANLAVILNLVMTVGVLMFLGAALSLPGIAGILLTLGMAVDANILVNERIREEKAAGKGLLQAVSAGYDRAFVTIVDSNLTTIITGVILYMVGTGSIRGFALTLILGLVISMFTALYVTRTLFLWGLERGILTEFRMMPLGFQSKIDWMGLRTKFIGVSAIVATLGTAAFAFRGENEKYDLEFTGGQRVVLALRSPIPIDAVRGRIQQAGLGEAAVRTIRSRGTDAEALDLATQSDRYEITAQLPPGDQAVAERKGREFTENLVRLFEPDLIPQPLTEMKIEGAEGQPDRPFSFAIHFVGDPSVEAVRAKLAATAVITKPEGLAVQKVGTSGGIASFQVSGTTAARDEGRLTEAVLRALKSDSVLTAAAGGAASATVKEIQREANSLELSEPVPQSDFIGPGVAHQLREQAMMAVLLSILAQIVYLRFRFRDFTYGFAAAVALVHDVLITLGAVAVCDSLGLAHVKINLPVIASFLTLIGFSMNDTIVVFDRIRENLGRSVHPSAGMINQAINQTLARSIRTSMTVFLVVLTLFVVNRGATSSLEGFAFVMLVGVVTGAYSSVAIAAPLLLFLPVYSVRLAAMGKPVVYGLLVAMVAGLGMAFSLEGAPAVVGALLASILPAHFFWHLLRWLPEKDPDALVKRLGTGAGAAAPAAVA